jgi:uncharacterized protein YkwD
MREAARAVLGAKLRGEVLPEPDAIAFAQRAAGEPHPWARAWAATAPALDRDVTLRAMGAWLTARGVTAGVRRCGVAGATAADGAQTLVVLAVDALADLAPLPTRARTGQWLTVEARLLVRARGAEVIVLGPGGAPRAVPTSFDGTTVRARFAPDGPGETVVQVLADVARGGPRPVLEASVFADVDPPAGPASERAPGEDAGADGSDDAALARMLGAARTGARLPPLARDPRLDAVARAHAARMARACRLAHDAGDGDPVERLRAAGLDAREAAENVAHAATLQLAHRALWASPSHRMNMLRREMGRVGVAVARDERGDAWVVEMFVAE